MICFNCKNASKCSLVLVAFEREASIDSCKTFIQNNKYTYREIANNDELMHLIYDYFLDNVDEEILNDHGGYEGIKAFIANYLRTM